MSLIDPAISRQLVDKMYEKRKAAALDLEKYAYFQPYSRLSSDGYSVGRFGIATKNTMSDV